MKAVRSAVIMIVMFWATVTFLFHTMRSMQVHDNATIVLKAPVCSLFSQVSHDGICVVHGSVSHSFIWSETEITTADGSLALIGEQYVQAMGYTDSDTHYEPVGKIGALIVALVIMLIGGWAALRMVSSSRISTAQRPS